MANQLKIGVDARPLESCLTGIGQYTYNLLKELVASGHEWFLYSSRPLSLDVLSGANVHSICANLNNAIASAALEQIVFPWWSRKNDIDIFWSPRHHLPLMLPKNIPKVVTIHDVVWKRAPATMRKANWLAEYLLMPSSADAAHRIIADTLSTKADLVELFNIDRDKISVIHLGGTNVERGTVTKCINRQYGISDNYILFVGTLEPRKNLKRLLAAYAKLNNVIKGKYELVVAGGSGWGPEIPDRIVRELGILERVKFTGFVEQRELTELIANASLLAMPSLYEGFGFPLVDAMSLSIPVLTSNISSMPEVTDGAAVLINPHDVDDIKNALERILSDENLRQDLVTKGKKRALAFSWQDTAKKTEAVFYEAIDSCYTHQARS